MKRLLLFLSTYCICMEHDQATTHLIKSEEKVSVASLIKDRLEQLHQKALKGSLAAALGFYFLYCVSLNPKKFIDWAHTYDINNPSLNIYNTAMSDELAKLEFGTSFGSYFSNPEFCMSHSIIESLKDSTIQEYFNQKKPREVVKNIICAWKIDATNKKNKGELVPAIALEAFEYCIKTRDTKVRDQKACRYLNQYSLCTPQAEIHPLVIAALTDQDERPGIASSLYNNCTIQ
ncbi:MAG: hypothetical protein M1114_03860 [Candidatus Dependentiae bacterium]|nr:hypothetical protein [Candidatus Dependentiae bacterium]